MTHADAAETHILVRPATDESDRSACYHLRYEVYVAEQGKPYPDADHDRRLLRDPLDERGTVLMATSASGDVVGTLRVNFGDDPAFVDAYGEKLDLGRLLPLGPRRLSFTSRLAINPRWRRSPVFRELVSAAFWVGGAPEVSLSICTCRPSLVPLFQHLGYQEYGPRFSEPGGGHQCALLLVTGDLEHLGAVGSPFYPLASRYPPDTTTRHWLSSRLTPRLHAMPPTIHTERITP